MQDLLFPLNWNENYRPTLGVLGEPRLFLYYHGDRWMQADTGNIYRVPDNSSLQADTNNIYRVPDEPSVQPNEEGAPRLPEEDAALGVIQEDEPLGVADEDSSGDTAPPHPPLPPLPG